MDEHAFLVLGTSQDTNIGGRIALSRYFFDHQVVRVKSVLQDSTR
jgi:hypothetical protein